MKNCLLSCLLLIPVLAIAQAPAPYVVKGKVGNLNAPAKMYLVYGPQVLDSATLQNGQFELRGSNDWPHSAELVLERQGHLREGVRNGMYHRSSPERVSLFISPEPVTVASPDSLFKARLTGGPQLAAYQQLQATMQPVYQKIMLAGKRKAPATEHDALNKEYVQTAMTFIKANPNAWASLETLSQLKMLAPPTYTEVGPLYEAFSPAMRNSPPGRVFFEFLEGLQRTAHCAQAPPINHQTPPGRFYGEFVQGLQRTAIGALAPSFTQQTPAGKPVSLADYRGKYVLVDFWASWCGPCRQENPAIINVYNAYKGRNFDIVGISLDDEKSRAKWLKAIADDQLPWTQLSDLRGPENEAAKSYGVQSVPENFLIDPTGKIVASGLHGAALEATLAKLIKH